MDAMLNEGEKTDRMGGWGVKMETRIQDSEK